MVGSCYLLSGFKTPHCVQLHINNKTIQPVLGQRLSWISIWPTQIVKNVILLLWQQSLCTSIIDNLFMVSYFFSNLWKCVYAEIIDYFNQIFHKPQHCPRSSNSNIATFVCLDQYNMWPISFNIQVVTSKVFNVNSKNWVAVKL